MLKSVRRPPQREMGLDELNLALSDSYIYKALATFSRALKKFVLSNWLLGAGRKVVIPKYQYHPY